MSSITATTKRMKQGDFSEEYYISILALLYKHNSPVTSFDTFGVQLGTIMGIYAREKVKQLDNINVVSLNKNSIIVQELKMGRVDVAVIEKAQAIKYSQANSELGLYCFGGKTSRVRHCFPKRVIAKIRI